MTSDLGGSPTAAGELLGALGSTVENAGAAV
jgi:hypothetical protein